MQAWGRSLPSVDATQWQVVPQVLVTVTRDGNMMTVVSEFVVTHRHGVVSTSKLGDPPSVTANTRYSAVGCAVPPFPAEHFYFL